MLRRAVHMPLDGQVKMVAHKKLCTGKQEMGIIIAYCKIYASIERGR